MITWEGSGNTETLTLQFHRSLFWAMQCLRKIYLSWLPCVHYLKYCKLLCMDLNSNHSFFLYEALVNKQRSAKAVYYTLLQVILLYFGNCRESGTEKNNLFHSLCTVYGLCRLMQIFWNEMFRRDHTSKAGVKKLAFLVCSRCIVNFTVNCQYK